MAPNPLVSTFPFKAALSAVAHCLDCFGGDAAALFSCVLELKISARRDPLSQPRNFRPFAKHSHRCRRCLCWFTPSPTALQNAERYGKPVNNYYLRRTPDHSSPAHLTTTRSYEPRGVKLWDVQQQLLLKSKRPA